MIAFGRPRALLVAAGVALVAAGMGGSAGAPAALIPTAVPRSTTTLDAPTSSTVPRSSTTATPTTGEPQASTSTTVADGGTTTTTRASTTTTTRPERPTSSTTATTSPTTTAAPTTTTAPVPCPSGRVEWSATFSARSQEEDRWTVETSGTIANHTGAAVEITSVTTSIATSDGSAEVRGRPSPRELGPGAQGTFAGDATVRSSSEPTYRSNAVTARWADTSLRSRCPAPR